MNDMAAGAHTRGNAVRRADGAISRWVRGWNPYDPAHLQRDGLEPVQIEDSDVRRGATRIVLVAVALFLVWATTMPLSAGTTLVGTVIPSGYRKAVQHQTGGIVQQILVQEGARVRQGEVLLRMNQLATDATFASLVQDDIQALASMSRLKAEMAGQGAIAWEPDLSALSAIDPRAVAAARASQGELFRARREQLGQQVAGLRAQAAGLGSAIEAHRQQLATLTDEYDKVAVLARDGYVPQTQMNTTLRSKAEQESALASAGAERGKIQSQIAELRSRQLSEVSKELGDAQSAHAALRSKITAARFERASSEIRAPVTGTVVGLKVFTEGGVISAGEVLMEIVPADGQLVIEARVPPTAIDTVSVGAKADIRFSSFNQTTTPVVEGTVRAVGVDKPKARPGEETRAEEDYYLATIDTTSDAIAKLGDKRLQAGMPADVIIKSGQRTFMSYLLKPLADKFALAFKD